MSALDRCLLRARRRIAGLLFLRHGAAALALGAAATVLLLLAGTQLLDWYWPAILFLAGLGFALYRTWRALPRPYPMAQQIDQRLRLHDALSTAFHFRSSRDGVAILQRDRAERIACEVALDQALPLRLEREFVMAGALLIAASGMFAVRYGVLRTLSLEPPLVSFQFDSAGSSPKISKNLTDRQRSQDPLQQMGMALDPEAQVDLGQAPDSALDMVDVPESVNQDLPQKSGVTSDKMQSVSLDAEGKESSEEGDDGKPGDRMGDSAPVPGGEQGNSPSSQKSDERGPQNKENNSLFDKMRDAMANMMSRLKMQPQQGGNQQTASSDKKGQNQGQSREKMDQRGTPQQGSQQQGDSTSPGEKGEQQGEGGERGEQGDSKQVANGSDQQGAKDQKSGMGKQDGAKDVQMAEQLEAMGKLAEIFGKRAQNVSGEIMVEVASGKQQLRTAYSDKTSQTSGTGGDIHRDEIPLVYQQYVQKYMQQIRGTAAAPPATKQ